MANSEFAKHVRQVGKMLTLKSRRRQWSVVFSAGYSLSIFFFEGQNVFVHLLTAGLGAGYRF